VGGTLKKEREGQLPKTAFLRVRPLSLTWATISRKEKKGEGKRKGREKRTEVVSVSSVKSRASKKGGWEKKKGGGGSRWAHRFPSSPWAAH